MASRVTVVTSHDLLQSSQHCIVQPPGQYFCTLHFWDWSHRNVIAEPEAWAGGRSHHRQYVNTVASKIFWPGLQLANASRLHIHQCIRPCCTRPTIINIFYGSARGPPRHRIVVDIVPLPRGDVFYRQPSILKEILSAVCRSSADRKSLLTCNSEHIDRLYFTQAFIINPRRSIYSDLGHTG